MVRAGLSLASSLTVLLAIAAPSFAEQAARPLRRSKQVPPTQVSPAQPSPDRSSPKRFEPYDPDRADAGRRPGFIDLGNGTEIRVGGRARFDYDSRR